jgi:DNA-directed RNA polymerase
MGHSFVLNQLQVHTMNQTQLEVIEREIEQEAVGLGITRYYRQLATGGEPDKKPGQALMRRGIEPLAAAIKEWTDEALSGKASVGGRVVGMAKFVSGFEPEDVAFITLRVALGTFAAEGRKLTAAAFTLSNALKDAGNSDAMEKANPKAFKKMMTKVQRVSKPGRRFVIMRKAMENAQVAEITWGRSEKLRLGVFLLRLCGEVTGLYTIERITRNDQTPVVIVPSQETLDWLEKSHQQCAAQAPHYLPMVVPPVPWTGVRGGGYLDRGLRLKLINSNRVNRNYMQELAHAELPMVYNAINALQNTAWRINKGVHRVLREVWEASQTTGKLPFRDALPIPQAPWGSGEPPTEEEGKAHRAKVARTHEANERIVSKRRAVLQKLWLAEKFAEFDSIYFPHVLDWRGRIYPVPTYVNPQGDDTGKALLEFAEGVPLGEEGAYWLAVHGANCFGIDKVPFADRIAWVQDNQDAILDSALRPLEGEKFWADAEDPYMFLAFCMEWAGLCSHVATGASTDTFVSYLPVSWDGSCNGLQNFSAMLRDPLGGKATNLIPQETPADIYALVAAKASEMVERDAAAGEVNAVYWRGKVTRKWAKRPTMTLPYGSGKYGFRDQLRAELQSYKLEHRENYIEGDEFLCSMYLANVMYDALGEVVVAARSAMDWLREASQIAAEEELPITWTTPAGLPVMQDYRVDLCERLEVHLGGKRLQLTVTFEGDELCKRKQAQGISPNFVHSLDAAHLMRTVDFCLADGIRSFAMVHDSYGSHAGTASVMHRCLRDAFIEQYGNGNVLEDFRDDLLRQLSEKRREKLPPLPAMGTLELAGVRDSEYFFA